MDTQPTKVYHGPNGIGMFVAVYAGLMLLTVLMLGLYAWLNGGY